MLRARSWRKNIWDGVCLAREKHECSTWRGILLPALALPIGKSFSTEPSLPRAALGKHKALLVTDPLTFREATQIRLKHSLVLLATISFLFHLSYSPFCLHWSQNYGLSNFHCLWTSSSWRCPPLYPASATPFQKPGRSATPTDLTDWLPWPVSLLHVHRGGGPSSQGSAGSCAPLREPPN